MRDKSREKHIGQPEHVSSPAQTKRQLPKKFIIIIVAVVLLLGVGAAALYAMSQNSVRNVGTTDEELEDYTEQKAEVAKKSSVVQTEATRILAQSGPAESQEYINKQIEQASTNEEKAALYGVKISVASPTEPLATRQKF